MQKAKSNPSTLRIQNAQVEVANGGIAPEHTSVAFMFFTIFFGDGVCLYGFLLFWHDSRHIDGQWYATLRVVLGSFRPHFCFRRLSFLPTHPQFLLFLLLNR
mmetsp:Transcript_19849/g.40880  ORF Transcript_19849/g.40880 Transcript_19849/m.40880 type:complete len:102 (+) Transcript_19849:755-1060(+)